jgi:uncharacterized protein YndB with AHSA1/START domain
MPGSTFVYVTFIRSTPEEIWKALTEPEFTKKFWFGYSQETTWKPGAPWKMSRPDGTLTDSGEIVEAERPKRLVIKWRNEFMPELKAEGYSRCTFEIMQAGKAVKLTVTHTLDKPNAKFIAAVANGWPSILSNLKSLLETGETIITRSDVG